MPPQSATAAMARRRPPTKPSAAWRFLHDLVTHPASDRVIADFQTLCGVTKTKKNLPLHVYFKAASMMGEEVFALIPLLFWIVPNLALPYMTHFGIILTLGQLLKDLLMLPRPPSKHSKVHIHKLEVHFGTEFGMPSTHTMAGFLPLAMLIRLSQWGYNVSDSVWFAAAVCIVSVALSRLYMGVHSVFDVIAGAVFAVGITAPLVLAGDRLDDVLYQSPYGVLIWVFLTLLFWFWYPRAMPWSASIGTACQIFGTWIGVGSAWWYTYHFHPELIAILRAVSLLRSNRPVDGLYSLQSYVIRTVLSYVIVGITKLLSKEIANVIFLWLYRKQFVRADELEFRDSDGNEVPTNKLYCVEVPVRYLYYLMQLLCLFLFQSINYMLRAMYTRLINYASLAWAAIFACPLIWSTLGLAPSDL